MASTQTHSFQNQYVAGKIGIPSWIASLDGGSLMERLESPKQILRCVSCRLVQYETRTGCCRRCDHPLPIEKQLRAPAPDLEPMTSGTFASGVSREKMSRRDWSAGLRRAVAVRTRLRRTELGISQVKFARLLGIPRSYLSRVENEHLLPGPAMLARLAEYLGIDFCSIWEGADAGLANTDRTSLEIVALAERLPEQRLAQVVARARAFAAAELTAPSQRLLNVA